jgi:hypothetical protein
MQAMIWPAAAMLTLIVGVVIFAAIAALNDNR